MSIGILKAVWGKQEGYVFVPRKKGKKWEEGRAFKYPDEWETVSNFVKESIAEEYDTYWCPLLFAEPKRIKETALKTSNILWADLDYVKPHELGNLKPSIAWASSSERYQGLWILDKFYDIGDVESINRDVSYAIGADKGGWDVTQVLRVPGSPNFKYMPPQKGKLLWAEKRIYSYEKVKELVKSESGEYAEESDTLESLLEGWDIPDRTRDLLSVEVEEVEVGERSDRLWEIETSLLEAGLPVMDIVKVIHLCPWNKFKGRRGEMEQIYKEVTKADAYVKHKEKEKLKSVEVATDPTGDSVKTLLWAVPFDRFMSKEIEPPQWLVEGIWQQGTYGMLAGEPKTYKSVLSTDLAIAVASGNPFLGTFKVCHTGAVLYIQEENNENTVQDRNKKITYTHGLLTSTSKLSGVPDDIPIYFCNNYGINLTDKDCRVLIEQTIAQIKPVLIILDPLYMMLGDADENSATEVRDILKWLTYLRNTYKCAIMICHHYNKAGSGTSTMRGGSRVRGTSQFHGWVESALYVKKPSEVGRIQIEREFRAFPSTPQLDVHIQLGEPGEVYYESNVEDDSADYSVIIKAEEVVSLLSVSPRSFEEIKELCKLSRTDTRDVIDQLEKDGVIAKTDGGGRGKKALYMLTKEGADSVKVEV